MSHRQILLRGRHSQAKVHISRSQLSLICQDFHSDRTHYPSVPNLPVFFHKHSGHPDPRRYLLSMDRASHEHKYNSRDHQWYMCCFFQIRPIQTNGSFQNFECGSCCNQYRNPPGNHNRISTDRNVLSGVQISASYKSTFLS